MSTDTWPPKGYTTQAIAAGQLLVCKRCGALVGTRDEFIDAHDKTHRPIVREVVAVHVPEEYR